MIKKEVFTRYLDIQDYYKIYKAGGLPQIADIRAHKHPYVGDPGEDVTDMLWPPGMDAPVMFRGNLTDRLYFLKVREIHHISTLKFLLLSVFDSLCKQILIEKPPIYSLVVFTWDSLGGPHVQIGIRCFLKEQ